MKRISPERLRRAISAISEWRQLVQPQKATHIWGLLALVEKGITKAGFKPFEENDDFDFWKRYNQVYSDDSPEPYVDPLTRQRRIKSHPHSNTATARKQTFENSWGAGVSKTEKGKNFWKFAGDYAHIIRDEALTKRSVATRLPVIDLAVWLFRKESFPDNATAKTLEQEFRKRFPQDQADYQALFEYRDEKPEQIFTAAQPSESEYLRAIEESLISSAAPRVPKPAKGKTSAPTPIKDDDATLLQVRELLEMGSSGIILRGAPGTGKTYYAHQIAGKLVDDPTADIFKVQFHPSYGYEDFVEGYAPSEDTKSGFTIVSKVFLNACDRADKTDGPVVLIIDEINRGDPARILGELLTYIELGYRDEEFHLPYSGKTKSIPSNLVVIGTMNPFDKSITELDMALVRRFDHVELAPQSEVVGQFLEDSGAFTPDQVRRISSWFDGIQQLTAPQGVGHTYFKDINHPEHLRLVWKYRVLPYCESTLDMDDALRANLQGSFDSMYAGVVGQQAPAAE